MKRVFFAVKIWKVTEPTWFLVQIWKNPIQMKKSGAATIELLQRFYLQKYSNCTYARIACLSTDMIFAKKYCFGGQKINITKLKKHYLHDGNWSSIHQKNYLEISRVQSKHKDFVLVILLCRVYYRIILLHFWAATRLTMIFMPLYSWYSVSNIQTEYFLSKWIYPYIYAAAVRFGCQWCKLRNCDVIQICRGWNFQFEFWINWLRWNFLRLGNFEPFLAIGFPSMAIFRPTNAKRNTLVRKKSL